MTMFSRKKHILSYFKVSYSKYSQPAFIYSKLTIETLGRVVKLFKLTINTPERPHWRRFSVFIANIEHFLHLVLAFLLLTFNM